MPGIPFQAVTVTRSGTEIGTYQAKFAYKDSRPRGLESPRLDLGEKWAFLIFQNITAPVLVGDLVTLADGTIFKIYDIRSYTSSLQVDLQRLPYISCDMWQPPSLTSSVDGASPFRLQQPAYTLRETPILVYLEPLADAPKAYAAAALGLGSILTAAAFSLEFIGNTNCVVYQFVNFDGATVQQCWQAVNDSDHWPVTNDYRTVMKRLMQPPVGITL